MTTTQVEFFQNNVIDGALTPEQAAQLMELTEGDTSTPLETDGQPEAITEQATPDVAAVGKSVEPEPKPVILAKDGVHTIDYEKLVEAREAEKHWKQVALDAQAKLEAAQNPAPAQPVPAVETPEVEEGLFGDFSEEAIAKGVEKMVARRTAELQAAFDARLNSVLAPLQAQQAVSAADAHFNAIQAVHPDVESIAQSADFKAWIDQQPSFLRPGYLAVINEGTSEQVIEALNTYKAATGKLAPPPAKSGVEAAAQAVIAKAKTAVPTSLTDFPGGTAGPGNKFEALDAMSPTQMSEAMQSMTPEQIETYLNRNFK